MKYHYETITEELINWYDKNRRILRWREEPLPYYVWISEIMLQQTRVEAVKRYFDRFITALPTIPDLAEAEEERLLKLWEGLGYYNRVRNIQKAAQILCEQYEGQLPKDYDQLLTLPGIGSYTAGAIASIAFQIKVPAVDGNVLRVMKRLAGSYDDITKANVKKQLELDLMPALPERPGDFNQAVMDLGATVCIPNGRPLCEQCPLKDKCIGFQQNSMMDLPVKPPKKERRKEEKTILMLRMDGKFAIRKRTESGLLHKLWELPNVPGKYLKRDVKSFIELHGYTVDSITKLPNAKHIFTHVEWKMTGYLVDLLSTPLEERKELEMLLHSKEFIWEEGKTILEQYALPGAFQDYKTFLIE